MYPVICKIGPVAIYSYGVMLAVAVGLCSYLLKKKALRVGFNGDVIFDFVFWMVLGGIIGARIFYVFLNFEFFVRHPSEIVMLRHGGLAWQGALIVGIVVGFIFIQKKSLPLWETIDLVAPYAALGQAIGRVGCFFQGCCYGREISWGIYFPVHHTRLHPTQLYSSFGLLIIFFILRKYQCCKKRPGQVFILYLILTSTQRFIIEFFRADHSILFLGLSIFQVICLGIMFISFYANILFKSRAKE